MKLICAGLPKTGTKTLALALRMLGYTVHDISEQWAFHMDEYNQALESKKMPDFLAMYTNVDSVTDAPACFFFEEIFQAFPKAKVLLMLREDEEAWVRSLMKTEAAARSTFSRLWLIFGFLFTPTGRKFKKHLALVGEEKFKNSNKKIPQYRDDVLKSLYREHNERVISVIPQDNLLVYNVRQGWKPLCDFLGVEVPDVPFPRANVNSEAIPQLLANSITGEKVFKEVVIELTVICLTVIVMIFTVLMLIFYA